MTIDFHNIGRIDIQPERLSKVLTGEMSQESRAMLCGEEVSGIIEPVASFEGCRYCTSFLGLRSEDQEAIWNTRIMESEHFVVVPTLGMLVPGWLLIVTKAHYLNMAVLPSAYYSELEDVKIVVRHELSSKFGPTVFFEHGPACPGKPVGCGIDHAHWHAVPLSFDLLPDLEVYFPHIRIHSALELRMIFNHHTSYLFYENQGGEAYAFPASDVPSQFFRRLVAQKIGESACWDWHIDAGLPNILGTLQRLRLSDKQVCYDAAVRIGLAR